MFDKTTKKLTHYLCQKDENKFAGLFANDGVYHDYIYGTFIGKQNIKKMIDNFFYRDAKNFYWEMYDHIYKDNIGYAKYRFSFISIIPDYYGKKVVLSGISFFRFEYDKIIEYSECVNGGIAMVQLGVKPEKMEKVFLKWFKQALDNDDKLMQLNNST